MADELDEIRTRIRLVELVGQSVSLKRSGKNWLGLCPFHDDRKPSFNVSDTTGHYKCWSCGEHGDMFTWVMKTQNVGFPEAVEILARQAGVTLKRRKPEDPSLKLTWQGAMTEALSFFRAEFAKSTEAKDYCEGRGLPQAILDTWEIGYAPDVGEALVAHLKKKGYALSECQKLFLVDQDSRGGYFDKFRGRLMFPIRDERGELVAFGGRVMGDGHPKYINSSDTPLYRKSRVLYGLNIAKKAISEGAPPVLCEGYLDVIACHMAGINTALASLGTALSEDHAKLLKRWARSGSTVILYDADEAGEKAALRAAEILQNEGLEAHVAQMPAGQDPDTLLKTAGAGALKLVVENKLTPTTFLVHQLETKYSPSDEAFWKLIVEALAESKNELEVLRLVHTLAPKYPDLRDPQEAAKALKRMINQRKRSNTGRPVYARHLGAPVQKAKLGIKAVEGALLRAFLSEEFRAEAWPHVIQTDIYLTGKAAELGGAIAAAFPEAAPQGPPAAWLHLVEDEAAREALVEIEMSASDRMTTALLTDTIALLNRERKKRINQELKSQETGDNRLIEIQRRLTELQDGSEDSPSQ